MDVLRARKKSVGIMETRFSIGTLSSVSCPPLSPLLTPPSAEYICLMSVFSGPNAGNGFEDVTSILFCTALSEYDQVLLEEKSQVRSSHLLSLSF